MNQIRLIVFDMAGTTVQDQHEVESCFAEAARRAGLRVSPERITAVQGWSKRFVFETLWNEQVGESHSDYPGLVEDSYRIFKNILEAHYRSHPVVPTEGCLEVFSFARQRGIQIALTTGFYREVTNIILQKLGWNAGLNEQYIGGSDSVINLSIASDEVPEGRPSPLMIQKALRLLGVADPKAVINIGDTPSDLESGRRAGCAFSFGLTNGTHTHAQLEKHPNDGLFDSLVDFKKWLEANCR